MTPPAKAGGFSGNGMSNPYRWRLKAPSGTCSQVQHIPRGVEVAAQHQTASGAAMFPLSQGLGHKHTAVRAALRGADWVYRDQRPTGAYCLVGQDRDELAPASVLDGLRQHRAGQSLDVQVFDGDQRVAFDQGAGSRVVEAAPLFGEVQVNAAELGSCVLPPPRTLLAAGQLALSESQAAFSRAEVARAGDLTAVAQDRKGGESHVDADGCIRRGQRF